MTRKDYILIAAALKGVHAYIDSREAGTHQRLPDDRTDLHDGVYLAAEHVADALARDNPRFDFSRFMTACGVQE